jgi:lysophospholipase L1-like esterase
LLVLILALPSFGQEFKKTLDGIDLADGDTLVFLGDSITHQCLYTQYVEDYFYTRYPNRRIRLHNAGVSGDQAEDALIRFDEDIAKFKPKYVTILIGMNDGHYTRFEHEIFDTYKRDMTTLLDKIEDIGATAILMHPTMFDLRPVLMGGKEFEGEDARQIHYNAVLAFFGAWGLQQANERGLGYVNMYEPLNRLTREQRKTDPRFTMIEDAVHPGPDGQLVMALALLNDIGADPVVSSIHVDRKGDKWAAEADGGTLSAISTDKISFTFTADSLPWVVPEEAHLGYRIADAGQKMSRETLRVTGLTAGKYYLKIDGRRVGTFDLQQLAAGVELQGNTKTPQYAQALEVAMLNKKRNDEAVRPMRDLWGRLKRYRERREEGEEEPESVESKQWRADFSKRVADLHEKAREFEEQIYKINRPQPHRYEIVSAE